VTPVTQQEAHAAIECLGRLAAVYQQRRQQLSAQVGLTEHQWEVLEEISTEHFMPSLFAQTRHSSRAAVSKTLRQLLDKGLTRVTAGTVDGRQRHHELSPYGRRVLAQLRAARESAIRDVWLTLDGPSLRHFSRFGMQLVNRLENYASQAKKE
jgi:DNA-binding MarR family transcriptional regulator